MRPLEMTRDWRRGMTEGFRARVEPHVLGFSWKEEHDILAGETPSLESKRRKASVSPFLCAGVGERIRDRLSVGSGRSRV